VRGRERSGPVALNQVSEVFACVVEAAPSGVATGPGRGGRAGRISAGGTQAERTTRRVSCDLIVGYRRVWRGKMLP